MKTYLERVTQPIEIVASLDDSDKSREMRSPLGDITEQSNLITIIERRDDAGRTQKKKLPAQ